MSDRLGHYRIVRALGSGGVGTVYEAEDSRLERRVAIKVLSAVLSSDPEATARFTREARTAARIQHPNVCTVYDIGSTDDGRAYLAMEYIEGRSLASILESEGAIDPVLAAAISLQVAQGLHAAHNQSVVHRDLKPGNIMISRSASGEVSAKIVDFGIAKAFGPAAERGLTQTGFLIGTPDYMSPEQLSGDEIGPMSDVYSLALVHFRMLTGSLPFAGTSTDSIIARVTGQPSTLREARPDIEFPGGIQEVLDTALARNPASRYESAATFASELAAVMGGSRSVSVPPEWLERKEDATRPGPNTIPSTSRPDETETAETKQGRDAGLTRVVRGSDWEPEPTAESSEQRTGQNTRMIPLPGASRQTRFPVALTLTRCPDPSLVGIRFVCERFPFVVGRAEEVDLRIPGDDALSRVHLEIDRDPDGFLVRDRSTNGIWVNGRHVQGRTEPLPFGTTLVLSQATSLTFVADVPMLPDLSGEVVEGRYRLESRLHSSIKAATYRSSDVRVPGVSRLIKVFSPILTELAGYRAEYERQTTVAARLQHPHIRKVLDFGDTPVRVRSVVEQCPWLCMELMEGGSLASRLEHGLPQVELVSEWVADLAAALAHAHRNGFTHGDLKPSCIVFDAEDTVYLSDFALSRSADSEAATAVVGSPAYLAPEQWLGAAPTPYSDQYSLAVLAYQMVTGSRPYEGQSMPEVRERNFQRGPIPAHEEAIRAGRSGLPKAVSAVLAHALANDPSTRYHDVLEFSRAFSSAFREPDRDRTEPRIFLSYRRRVTSGWAITVATALQDRHGCSVFIDTRASDSAPRIPDRLRQEIERCDVFVCLLAPDTLESAWVRQEIDIADASGKPMVPIFFQEFEPADIDTSADPFIATLLDYEAVRLYDRDVNYVDAAIARLSERIQSLIRRAQR